MHKLLDALGAKREGGFLVLKIDLGKAYDKIYWKFLFVTLLYFNFSAEWINLFMSCVTNAKTSILWNGEIL